MIGLLCFVLAVLASPFKSKSRLEAENAVLRHQLIVLRRRSQRPHPGRMALPERLIGSIRRECLDHIIVSGEAHLRRILISYTAYYNSVRTHRSLNKDAPVSRSEQRTGVIRSRAMVDFITTMVGFRFSVHTRRGHTSLPLFVLVLLRLLVYVATEAP
jgi:hypothetical protein